MEMKFAFKATARCRVYEKGNNERFYSEDISLIFNKKTAMNFLFRFAPYAFNLDGYKVIFHMNNLEVDGLQLVTDDKIYLVTNLNQLFIEIHEGYFNILLSEKMIKVMNYDFDTNYTEVTDEFTGEPE